MALDMSNKLFLSQKILPAIDFQITCNGITVNASERLRNPRFLPFDIHGRCSGCRGTEAELDFIVTKEGITIYCSRFRGKRFVPFDVINDLPGHCFFKIRNKGRVFNVPYGQPPPILSPKETIVHHEQGKLTQPVQKFIDSFLEVKRKPTNPNPSPAPLNKKLKLSENTASAGKQSKEIPKENGKQKVKPELPKLKFEQQEFVEVPQPPPPQQNDVTKEEKLDPLIQEFYESLASATYHLDQKPSQQEKINILAQQRKDMDEQLEEAIASIAKN